MGVSGSNAAGKAGDCGRGRGENGFRHWPATFDGAPTVGRTEMVHGTGIAGGGNHGGPQIHEGGIPRLFQGLYHANKNISHQKLRKTTHARPVTLSCSCHVMCPKNGSPASPDSWITCSDTNATPYDRCHLAGFDTESKASTFAID